eukprot:gnl/TRDRNA2_/TRDRNA2_199195_c0_seq1.p1 gnl/TRDRNA2_/TRDRNA2_199195_c0~~gnl/TRDRNA2_/TRDRNA2_199195_c0_seq1.p1  ORF type:complete len:561 (+),score=87.06 gnl/TRDRNA2_/TRDRNA2_199195_c0_seq1:44-1726(+)
MMRNIIVVLVAFAELAGATDVVADRLANELIDNLFDRALQAPISHADLDDTSSGKLAHLAVGSRTRVKTLLPSHAYRGDSALPQGGKLFALRKGEIPFHRVQPQWSNARGSASVCRAATSAESTWEKARNLVATNTATEANNPPVNKKITILGSTGSIGTQTLDICRSHAGMFVPVGLSAGKNVKLLLEQVKEWQPEIVACDDSVFEELKAGVEALGIAGYNPKLMSGAQGTIEVARYAEAETVVTGIVGCAGLIPTIEAIKAKKDIALANKETLIAGGPVLAPMFEEYGVSILPVDSEHSAIFQCLQGVPKGGAKKIILTGSGGTFRDMSVEEMKKADPDYLRQRATTHPNWDMGAKITVDSSTMMNKGLEVIEAHWLYGVDYDNIEVVIHPQSIVHSAIETQDTAVLMQTGWPDMRLPILYALSYPSRVPADLPNPRDGRNFDDWWKGDGKDGKLNFFQPDLEKYPAIKLAYRAGRRGGTMPAILSAANEMAVELLLDKKLEFLEIPATLDAVMKLAESENKVIGMPTLDDIVEADRWAREAAAKVAEKGVDMNAPIE